MLERKSCDRREGAQPPVRDCYCFVAVKGSERPFCSAKPVIVLSAAIVPEKFHVPELALALVIYFHAQRTVCPAIVPAKSPLASGPMHDPFSSLSVWTNAQTGTGPFCAMIFHEPERLVEGCALPEAGARDAG